VGRRCCCGGGATNPCSCTWPQTLTSLYLYAGGGVTGLDWGEAPPVDSKTFTWGAPPAGPAFYSSPVTTGGGLYEYSGGNSTVTLSNPGWYSGPFTGTATPGGSDYVDLYMCLWVAGCKINFATFGKVVSSGLWYWDWPSLNYATPGGGTNYPLLTCTPFVCRRLLASGPIYSTITGTHGGSDLVPSAGSGAIGAPAFTT
jgi:hypothetical protein